MANYQKVIVRLFRLKGQNIEHMNVNACFGIRDGMTIVYIILFLCLFSIPIYSANRSLYPLKTVQQKQDFQYLTENLRCLVCSNETLAGSNAPLAADLRREIYQKIKAGFSRKAVLHYVVKRYGDYVLYKPPLMASTYILWFLPFILLVLGLVLLYYFICLQKRQKNISLTMEEQKMLETLLNRDKE